MIFNAATKENVDALNERIDKLDNVDLDLMASTYLGWSTPKELIDKGIYNSVDNGVIRQRVGRYLIYSGHTMSAWGSNGAFVINTTLNAKGNTTACNTLNANVTALEIYNGTRGGITVNAPNQIVFRDASKSDASGWNAYFSANPTYVYYELSTEVTSTVGGTVGDIATRFVDTSGNIPTFSGNADYIGVGSYLCVGSTTSNLPNTTSRFIVNCWKNGNYIVQNATRVYDGCVFTRGTDSGTWSAWTRLVTESDLTPTLVTPTLDSSVSNFKGGIVKTGNMVFLQCQFDVRLNANGRFNVGTIPMEYKPLGNMTVLPLVGENENTDVVHAFLCEVNGSLVIAGKNDNVDVSELDNNMRFSGAWVTA